MEFLAIQYQAYKVDQEEKEIEDLFAKINKCTSLQILLNCLRSTKIEFLKKDFLLEAIQSIINLFEDYTHIIVLKIKKFKVQQQ